MVAMPTAYNAMVWWALVMPTILWYNGYGCLKSYGMPAYNSMIWWVMPAYNCVVWLPTIVWYGGHAYCLQVYSRPAYNCMVGMPAAYSSMVW